MEQPLFQSEETWKIGLVLFLVLSSVMADLWGYTSQF
jgi:hypothetical protein